MRNPKIEILAEKKLVGKCMEMSFRDNRTGLLWRQFQQRRREITNIMTEDKISMQIYDTTYFDAFQPDKRFEKWATVEVSGFEQVPDGMETYILESGLYAVFFYKGSSADKSIFQYIFTNWLPNSEYTLDDRPHFEVLGENYKNNDPDSEEEIWIPIKLKATEDK